MELSGSQVERFVPGDGLELSGAARTGSFQGMQQAVGVVLAAQGSPAARAGAQQRRGRIIAGAVICIQPGDAPILDVRDQDTATAAVVCRAAHAHQAFLR